MTPVGATSSRPVSFVLISGGNLYEHTSAGFTFLAGNVALVSNQGVDSNGRAMVDFVTTGGLAYEFHDGIGSTYLASGVKDAKAGQEVSYVLLTNGSLYEVVNPSQQYPNGGVFHVRDGVVALSAGTDRYGVSSVDVILTSGSAYEISNTSGAHLLTSGVRAIGAGQGGESEILLQNGNAYEYREVTNSSSFLASNAAQVTAGTDSAGNLVIDLLYSNGNLSEYRASSGWVSLGTGVKSVSNARAGLVDVLYSNGNAYEHTTSGFTYLTGAVIQAV
jgi:hypothetical protein